ncbi:protein ripply2-like [Genypterus blacodes]|uniref:protein ripply2-like n=1 Tax=Genypterus blacodes TaxID=154954 RepID=UPI003F75FA45
MESFTTTTTTTETGLTSVFAADGTTQRAGNLWRPWVAKEEKSTKRKIHSMPGHFSDAKCPKTFQLTHPVKLYWPKSKCFDYLYQDAETLLRNYPVQATICPYQDSSSDEESDEEEEDEKEWN